MAQPIKHQGPYMVIRQKVGDRLMLEVVERIQPDIYIDPPVCESLRPRKLYSQTQKQAAYQLAARLNQKHAQEA